MKNTLVTALAAAALVGSIGLAYGQTKTEKGDPAAGTSYSLEPKQPDQGMTAQAVGAPPTPYEPKGGVKVIGQSETKGSGTVTGSVK